MNKKAKSTKNLFLSGVLILTISNLIVKVIGLGLKVPLSSLIQNTGMGYYTSAYDIYVWLYMVSTAGIPVAISLMVSDTRSKGNVKEAKKIFSVALKLFACVGLFCMCVLMFGSKLFSSFYKLELLYWALIAIAPTLLFVCIAGAIRGYFQGFQNMVPTSISEVIESLGKLLFGILFAIWSMKHFGMIDGVGSDGQFAKSAAMTILGLTIGCFLSMAYLIIKKLRFNEDLYNAEFAVEDPDALPVRTSSQILKALILIAIPITISSSMMSFTTMLDGMIVSSRLASLGYSEGIRSGILGAFKTQVVTFFNLPPVLIYPVSTSLVPYISTIRNAGTKEELNNIMNSAVKVCSIIAMPCALGMAVLSKPIIQLMFAGPMKNNPTEMSFDTPVLLSVQALAVFFIAMLSISTAFLQSHKLERKPIIGILCGSGVKLISSFILIGIPSIQILGAPIGTLLCYITITIVNFAIIKKHIGFTPSFVKCFIRPLISAAICAAAAWGSYTLISMVYQSRVTVLIAILIAVVVYVISLLLTKSISEDDMKLIPKGEKIYSKLNKIGLMK